MQRAGKGVRVKKEKEKKNMSTIDFSSFSLSEKRIIDYIDEEGEYSDDCSVKSSKSDDGTTSEEAKSDDTSSFESFTSSDSTSSRISLSGVDESSCICEVCGDGVEQEGHRVCFWHALTLKDKNQAPKYDEEAEYALSKYFNDIGCYLNRVKQKREDFLKRLI